jgi:membrane fusion protein, multidrug efflux system
LKIVTTFSEGVSNESLNLVTPANPGSLSGAGSRGQEATEDLDSGFRRNGVERPQRPCWASSERSLKLVGFFSTFRLRACCAQALFFVLCVISACSGDANGKPKTADPRKKMAVPVTVATAVTKPVPVQLRAIGNVQAYATVLIRARVGGELQGVHFKEGEEVRTGALLFTIDPRPFEAALKQAEANLARDRSQLERARKQAERYASVVKRGYVSEDQNDQILANAAALEASVRAYEAAVENARLDLKYCIIRSPVNGVTGQIKVDQGNLVKANDTDNPMVTIRQTSPIYVVFSVPEQNLPQLKKHMAAQPLDVAVVVPGDEGQLIRGELDFIDNSVDQTTGTILLRATFTNKDKVLWPGQFVNVTLTLTTQPDAVVIPSHALQTGQQGSYVFVVNPDSTAEYRPVTLTRTIDGEAVVARGVAPGDKVVTDGQLRLTQGAQVTIVRADDAVIEEKRQ